MEVHADMERQTVSRSDFFSWQITLDYSAGVQGVHLIGQGVTTELAVNSLWRQFGLLLKERAVHKDADELEALRRLIRKLPRIAELAETP